jgi:putative oxidoreductase
MKYFNLSQLILRVAAGGMMLTHGYPKFLKLSTGDFAFGDPIGLGVEVSLVLTVFAEFVCSILIVLGFFTRMAAIPLIFTMLVAVFVVHRSDPFSKQELGLMYAAMFAVIGLLGPGDLSIDHLRGRAK